MSNLFLKIANKPLFVWFLSFLIIAVSGNFAFAANDDGKFISDLKKYRAPKIEGITSWLGSKPINISEQKGKVVLVDFWTYSCINCIRTLPYMNKLQEKYGDKGLVIVGVHAPEFDFEKDKKNVALAIKRFGIKYAVGLDNNRKTWKNFDNKYWPAHYLIDQNGDVVYTHFGEGEYDVMDNNIAALLKISDKSSAKKKGAWFDDGLAQEEITPETYLGFNRADRNVNEKDGKIFEYPKKLPLNFWAFAGKWKVAEQHSQTLHKDAALRLNFKAKKVFLVMDSQDKKAINVEVKLNGEMVSDQAGVDVKQGFVVVNQSRLYELVQMKKSTDAILEIKGDRAGLRVYAFTFE